MSHKASSWLAEIPASALTGAEFRVLFHLCDAHNSKRDVETSCFPSQDRLREATGLSNGGLNNALNSLEAGGLILRVRRTVPGSAIQRTYYILGFDLPEQQEQTPLSGVGANSTFCEANSTFRGSKLHTGGVSYEPVRNLKKEPVRDACVAREAGVEEEPQGDQRKRSDPAPTRRQAATSKIAENSDAPTAGAALDHDARLQWLAAWINSGDYVPTSMITNTTRDALLASGLVTLQRLRELQIY